MSTLDWQPIANAPKDGSPVWARGHDFGDPGGRMHVGWVYWCDDGWAWAGNESCSAEQLMRAVDMLRGTAKAGEVQCFTTAATMPINPADCSIGEGSGSACPGLAVRTLDEIPPLFGVLPHPETAIGYQRLTQLAQVHRSRCDQAFARVAMHGHAPVPFNPETWTGVKS